MATARPFTAAVLRREVVHGEVNAIQLAARHAQVTRGGRAAGEHDGVEVREEIVGGDVDADMTACPEDDAFRLQQREPAIEHALFELELGMP